MNSDQQTPLLVVVTGLQGSGKSTAAGLIADHMGATVVGWDWLMAGLTPFFDLQEVLTAMNRDRYKSVGWALMHQMAISELRRQRSVVLDGMAQDSDLDKLRDIAKAHDAQFLSYLICCNDEAKHRNRIENRDRQIPGWHELSWDQVLAAKKHWLAPTSVDRVIDTGTGSGEQALFGNLIDALGPSSAKGHSAQ